MQKPLALIREWVGAKRAKYGWLAVGAIIYVLVSQVLDTLQRAQYLFDRRQTLGRAGNKVVNLFLSPWIRWTLFLAAALALIGLHLYDARERKRLPRSGGPTISGIGTVTAPRLTGDEAKQLVEQKYWGTQTYKGEAEWNEAEETAYLTLHCREGGQIGVRIEVGNRHEGFEVVHEFHTQVEASGSVLDRFPGSFRDSPKHLPRGSYSVTWEVLVTDGVWLKVADAHFTTTEHKSSDATQDATAMPVTVGASADIGKTPQRAAPPGDLLAQECIDVSADLYEFLKHHTGIAGGGLSSLSMPMAYMAEFETRMLALYPDLIARGIAEDVLTFMHEGVISPSDVRRKAMNIGVLGRRLLKQTKDGTVE